MRVCLLPRCDVDLDEIKKKSTALYCCPEHKAEHHRLVNDGAITPSAVSVFAAGLGQIRRTYASPRRAVRSRTQGG